MSVKDEHKILQLAGWQGLCST